MNKKTSWSGVVVSAGVLIFLIWQDYKNDKFNLGHYFLGISILVIISGIVMSFSKKERERARKRAIADLPERASLIDTPDADEKAKRRGYIMLIIGVILFITWSTIYGFSSLSTN